MKDGKCVVLTYDSEHHNDSIFDIAGNDKKLDTDDYALQKDKFDKFNAKRKSTSSGGAFKRRKKSRKSKLGHKSGVLG